MPRKSAPASRSARKTRSRTRTASANDYVLHIALAGSKPLIWRRVLVPDALTLGDLHAVIQALFNWDDSHLHVFNISKKSYAPPSPGAYMPEGKDEDEDDWFLKEVLTRPRMKFRYEYDFGDSWIHEITVERIAPADPDRPRLPLCLGGEMAAPPEDSGGIQGYQHMLSALQDPVQARKKEVQEYRERLGDNFDPTAFSVEEVNLRLASTFGVTAPTPREEAHSQVDGTTRSETGRVWAGTVIDATAAAGPASAFSGDRPILAVWFDVTDLDNVRLAAAHPGFASDPESPLIQGLFNPVPGVERPNRIHGGTSADVQILKNQSFEGLSVEPRPLPAIAESAQMFLDDMLQAAGDRGRENNLLESMVPVPGQAEEIDEPFARSWCEAALACWKAKPWKKISDTQAFELTFPGGEVRIAGLIGQSRQNYGILLYNSLDDFHRMADFAEQSMSGDLPPDSEEMPLVLSLNFDERGELPEDLSEYLAAYGPQWKRQRYKPYVLKVVQTRPQGAGTDDFRITGQAAFALGLLAEELQKKSSWPPAPGFQTEMEISWRGKMAKVGVRFLGE